MSGNFWWDIVFWFFAIAGLLLMLCDIVRYFMFKNTLPAKLTVLIPGNTLGENCRVSVANLLNLLYEQNPDGDFELIVVDNSADPALSQALDLLCDAGDCIYAAGAADVAEYIKHSF